MSNCVVINVRYILCRSLFFRVHIQIKETMRTTVVKKIEVQRFKHFRVQKRRDSSPYSDELHSDSISECEEEKQFVPEGGGEGHSQRSVCSYKMYTILILIVGVISIFISNGKENKALDLKHHIQDIQKKFPVQDETTWPDIVSGIVKIFQGDPTEPGIFLLLGHSDTAFCLASEVGVAASEVLNHAPQQLIVLEGNALRENQSLTEDNGLLIIDYKHLLERQSVMIIRDLDKIPWPIAQIFHNFCDVQTPLVKKALYVFTMHAEASGGTSTALAEEILHSLWKSEDKDIVQPLVTRITDTVIYIKPEMTEKCTKFPK